VGRNGLPKRALRLFEFTLTPAARKIHPRSHTEGQLDTVSQVVTTMLNTPAAGEASTL